MFDALIIGAGPAGLSAAVYASRAGLKTAILTGATPGGLLTTTEKIDNYLGTFGSTGAALAENFLKHAQEFGAQVLYRTVTTVTVQAEVGRPNGFTVLTAEGESYNTRAVIYAAGSEPRKLGVPGEQLEGVSYCGTCDGAFFADDRVAVVGAGETAVEDALYLSSIAATVDVFVRSEWRATAPQVALLESKENVRVHLGEEIASIEGEEAVESVTLKSGLQLPLEGVFIAVGQLPQTSPAEPHATLYENGFIHRSEVEGFFVAGDVADPNYRQVAVAVGDGARAGIDATAYLLSQA